MFYLSETGHKFSPAENFDLNSRFDFSPDVKPSKSKLRDISER